MASLIFAAVVSDGWPPTLAWLAWKAEMGCGRRTPSAAKRPWSTSLS